METVNDYIETDLGNVAPNPRGEYNLESVYEYLDLVDYKGGSYLCIADTATGIAPAQGKNSSTWQLLTLPGNLTPEYIATHDDVINKAASAAEDAAQTAADRVEVENMKENVSHLQAETIEAASQVSADKESAAGYAAAAEASRKAAAEAEANVTAQVNGFDEHVTEKTEEAATTITDERTRAIQAVDSATQAAKSAASLAADSASTATQAASTATSQATAALAASKTATSAASETMKAAKAAQEDIATAKSNAIKAVQDAATAEKKAAAASASAAATSAENAATSAESAKTSANNAVQSAKSVEDASKQIEQNKKDVASLKSDLSNKITKFYASNQGETHIADSDNGKIQDMMLYGKSSQDGTPTPENPVEIKSVVNPVVKLTNEDGLNVQSVTLNNITLNAIPVSSGGNVTIGEQQYISDYLDIEKGKLYRKVKRINFKDAAGRSIVHGFHSNGNGYLSFSIKNAIVNQIPMSNKYKGSKWTTTNGYAYVPNDSSVILVDNRFTDKQTAIKLVQDIDVIYALSSPTEEDLSLEQIKSLKSLSTNYPVTNITVGSEELDGYAIFNYPVSMANGWNYVKQQLNDNRDYIYDMDLQSAEAYVNSEYAVALTELEV